jgi:hypothetical protein
MIERGREGGGEVRWIDGEVECFIWFLLEELLKGRRMELVAVVSK